MVFSSFIKIKSTRRGLTKVMFQSNDFIFSITSVGEYKTEYSEVTCNLAPFSPGGKEI
jgi:hypothetical protein